MVMHRPRHLGEMVPEVRHSRIDTIHLNERYSSESVAGSETYNCVGNP